MASKDARRRGAAASAPSEEQAAEAEEAWLELPLGVGRARQTVSEAAVTHAELQRAAVACITQAVLVPLDPAAAAAEGIGDEEAYEAEYAEFLETPTPEYEEEEDDDDEDEWDYYDEDEEDEEDEEEDGIAASTPAG